jgi:hypothetical protein
MTGPSIGDPQLVAAAGGARDSRLGATGWLLVAAPVRVMRRRPKRPTPVAAAIDGQVRRVVACRQHLDGGLGYHTEPGPASYMRVTSRAAAARRCESSVPTRSRLMHFAPSQRSHPLA